METLTLPRAKHAEGATKAPQIYLAGLGAVGRALLGQLAALPQDARTPRLVGACTSRQAVWHEAGTAPNAIAMALSASSTVTDWEAILARLEAAAPGLVFVDATGSMEVARHHARLLEAGVHVVTPSKHAFTQEQCYFDRLVAAMRGNGVQCRYETTVGAGLPVVQTVRDLVATGDRLRSVRGAVSGTLTFVFSELRRGEPFSRAVQSAVQRGYAEPDVRDDLSGEDVARKFIILARTAGLRVERRDVEVESLVPEGLRDGRAGDFLDRLTAFDSHWRWRTRTAEVDRKALQYVGRLEDGRIHVGVEAVSLDAPFGRLEGTDNLFELHTDRYDASPLIIRGPGAGPEVTAAGVLADLLKIAEGTGHGRS